MTRFCPIGPALLTGVLLALAGCSGGPSVAPALPASPASPTSSTFPTSSPTASRPSSSITTRSARTGLSHADVVAGLLSRAVVRTGSGELRVVNGAAKAPGGGKVVRVRVEVEGGLKVAPQVFARFVLATLNDDRSWSHDGARTFARTHGRYDIRVVLASPATSAKLCRPLVTYGKLSCGSGNTAVLTMYRWVKAIPEYRSNPTGYRHYVVNHEVGHTLGHHHEYCAGKGKVAPVMMQQTKGLLGCRPNPWPFP